MGKKAPKAPPAPSPDQYTQAQAKATPSVYGPQYSIERKINPATGQFEAYINESDPTKQFRIQSEGLGQGLGGYSQQLMGNLQGSMTNDWSRDANRLEQASYNQAMSRMQPDLQDRERQLQARLAMQGIPMGSEAYNREMSRFERDRNDAQQQAAFQAMGAGRQEQSRLADLRNQSFNELVGALGARSGIAPNFNQYLGLATGGLDGTKGLDQQYQSAMQNYQNQMQSRGSTYGLLGQIGGSILGAGMMPGGFLMSSKKWKKFIDKTDHQQNLQKIDQLPVEVWSYRDEKGGPPHIGCYAEDFKELFGIGDGETINTVDAIGVCMSAIKALSEKVKLLEGGE